MGSICLEPRNRFTLIGALMVVIGLMFLIYMGDAMIHSTKQYWNGVGSIERVDH